MIMKVLKDMTLNDKPIRAGEYVRTDNPEIFLKNRYARHLTPKESHVILNAYVDYADKVFGDQTASDIRPQGTNFRLSKQGTLWDEDD